MGCERWSHFHTQIRPVSSHYASRCKWLVHASLTQFHQHLSGRLGVKPATQSQLLFPVFFASSDRNYAQAYLTHATHKAPKTNQHTYQQHRYRVQRYSMEKRPLHCLIQNCCSVRPHTQSDGDDCGGDDGDDSGGRSDWDCGMSDGGSSQDIGYGCIGGDKINKTVQKRKEKRDRGKRTRDNIDVYMAWAPGWATVADVAQQQQQPSVCPWWIYQNYGVQGH